MTDEAYPTSFAQQRLWFVEQLVPGTAQHNLMRCYRVHGTIDVESLRASVNQVVARHESLRTAFDTVNGAPVQLVAPTVRVPVTTVDTTDAWQAVRAFAGEPFDLSRPGLCRVGLIRDEACTLLAIVTHHLVTDGWSLGVLAEELTACYRACRSGTTPELPSLGLQYVDFALWQAESTSTAEFERRLADYAAELAGAPQLLQLPHDRPRPSIQTFAGDAIRFEVPAELTARVAETARRYQATPYLVLLTAYFLVSGRWAGQPDLLVATPIAGREDSRLEPLIGFFADNVVLRGDLTGNPTLARLLERVRDHCLNAFSRRPVPFDRLVEELAPERALTHNPLVQVMFSLQNTPPGRLELPDVRLERVDPGTTSSPFDLALDLGPNAEDGLAGRVVYATDLFEADTARRFAHHFLNAVRAIVDDPDRPLADTDILDADEREHLLRLGTGPVPEPDPTPLPQWIRRTARAHPDRTAVVDAAGHWSYRELIAHADAVADLLRTNGIEHQELVAVCLPRDRFMLATLLGVWTAGAAFVPLDPGYPAARLEFMVADVGSRLLLTTRDLAGTIPHGPGVAVRYVEELTPVDARDRTTEPYAAGPTDLAYAIYTSGSTGRPKGVLIEHLGIANQIEAFAADLRFTADDRMLAMTSMSFDPFLVELFVPLVTGGVVDVVETGLAGDPERLDAMLRERSVTVAQATPSTWTLYCEHVEATDVDPVSREPLRLRQVLTGGEELSEALASRLLKLGLEVHNVYGPTETTVWATRARIDSPDAITVGRPIDRMRLYVMDATFQGTDGTDGTRGTDGDDGAGGAGAAEQPTTGRLAPPGVPGELWVAGVGVARGFLNRPELTAQKFVRAPDGTRAYRSGDLASWNPDGTLRFLGRIDHQVKVRGHRIELGEIDATLRRAPAIRDSLTTVRTDASGEQILVTAVVPSGSDRPDELAGEAKRWARRELPEHMVPTLVLGLDSLPRTPSGKQDRRAIADLATEHLARMAESTAPDGPEPDRPADRMQQLLHDLWCEMLHVDAVSVTANIFDFGATSLSTVRVRKELAARHDIDVPLTAFFAHPSITALAARLADPSEDADQPGTPSGRRDRTDRRSMRATANRRRATRGEGNR